MQATDAESLLNGWFCLRSVVEPNNVAKFLSDGESIIRQEFFGTMTILSSAAETW